MNSPSPDELNFRVRTKQARRDMIDDDHFIIKLAEKTLTGIIACVLFIHRTIIAYRR